MLNWRSEGGHHLLVYTLLQGLAHAFTLLSWAWVLWKKLFSSAQAIIIKYHRLSDWNNIFVFSQCRRLKVLGQGDSMVVFWWGIFYWLAEGHSHCHNPAFPWCIHVEREHFCISFVSLPLLIKALIPLMESLPLWLHLVLCCAKSLQSCPVDGSLPGSSVHEIPQARIVEWVALHYLCSVLTSPGSLPVV